MMKIHCVLVAALTVAALISAVVIALSDFPVTWVSTDKTTYLQGENVKINYGSIQLLWQNCRATPDLMIYEVHGEESKSINHRKVVYSFGSQFCLDGKLFGGAYHCDVVWTLFPPEFYNRSIDYEWDRKMLEPQGKVSSCKAGQDDIFLGREIRNYVTVNAPTGKYIVQYGGSKARFELK